MFRFQGDGCFQMTLPLGVLFKEGIPNSSPDLGFGEVKSQVWAMDDFSCLSTASMQGLGNL